ncbi:MAG TPA: hypothetical protein VFT59_05250 [Candidatus Saccharimonadales bacterium]|nr:hypothetical protein [Candidatus Saccharimonadales bacterium]
MFRVLYTTGQSTIQRLHKLMELTKLDPTIIQSTLKPLRDVRSARQKPAHAIRKNLSDKTFVHKQVALMGQVDNSLLSLRTWLTSHPNADIWKPEFEDDRFTDLMF